MNRLLKKMDGGSDFLVNNPLNREVASMELSGSTVLVANPRFINLHRRREKSAN